MLHNEDFTLGYNCELKHKLIHVPRAAIGVSISYEDETLVERTKRHDNQFSILARDNDGISILGFLNNRIKNHYAIANNWRPGTGLTGFLRPRIGGTHWPTILSACMAIFGVMAISLILYRSKILGRLWICRPGLNYTSNQSIYSGTSHGTSSPPMVA